MIFFFFQAEDGIRDVAVTGVQTCALPIWPDGKKNGFSSIAFSLDANRASLAPTLRCSPTFSSHESAITLCGALIRYGTRGPASSVSFPMKNAIRRLLL